MAKTNSKYKYMYDAAASVALLPYGSVKTADFTGEPHVLDKLDGLWNMSGELADDVLSVIVNVEDLAFSVSHDTTESGTITLDGVTTTPTTQTATLTLSTVITGDALTIADGVHGATTLAADTDFDVGANDGETATNLAAAINAKHTANTLDASATAVGAVITVKITHGTGAAFSAVSATITASAFSGTDLVRDKITITDGVKTITFTTGVNLTVGGNDTATATNLATAINAAHTGGTLDASATSQGAVVTVTTLHPTGAGFSDASDSFETTNFTPAGLSGGDETYTLNVEAGPTDFATSEVVGHISVVSRPGQYVVLLDMDTVKQSQPNVEAIRIVGLIGGTAPSITAYSWIADIKK